MTQDAPLKTTEDAWRSELRRQLLAHGAWIARAMMEARDA